MLSTRDRIALWWQVQLSRAFLFFFYYSVLAWVKFVQGYRVPQLGEVRAKYRELRAQDSTPLLICANHLTMIDSLLLLWALVPGWKCLWDSALMPWNLPDKTNFSGNIFIRTLCYFGRCLYVFRGGPREEIRRMLLKVQWLLGHGHSIMIFPEGGRSRTGRVDTENFSYGVGNIVQECPEVRVLCIFMRGKSQTSYSTFPARGEEFYFDMQMIRPRAEANGLRGAREIARQIVGTLAQLEGKYFGKAPRVAGQ